MSYEKSAQGGLGDNSANKMLRDVDPSLIPRTCVKMLGMVTCAYNPRARELETEVSLELTRLLVGSRLMKG